MEKEIWKDKIVEACKEAGTYQPFYNQMIDTLASILEKRDNAEENFDKLGRQTVLKHTNKGGATNIVKNPALVVIMDLNSQALAYWRDLGLTPSGLKRLNASAVENKIQTGSFEQILAGIMDE